MKIPYAQLRTTLQEKLVNKGFESADAEECAHLFAQATLDGVHSHGVNRFVLFLNNIDKGMIKVGEKPERVKAFNALEQWDGHLGSGPNNAAFAMKRAMKLADDYGISCVALRNTNHWMRGGNFGLMAAEKGYMSICWSNTTPNMPVWGGQAPWIGNNPLIFSLPGDPNPVLLDMSMSLFSYGKMETHQREGKKLPFPGGVDKEGKLTDDATAILESQLPISIGYWKGSGLSILLDMFAAMLSEGRSTEDIGKSKAEYGLSQIFICLKPEKLMSRERLQEMSKELLQYIKRSPAINDEVRYPSERSFQIREQQMREGVEVDEEVWAGVLAS